MHISRLPEPESVASTNWNENNKKCQTEIYQVSILLVKYVDASTMEDDGKSCILILLTSNARAVYGLLSIGVPPWKISIWKSPKRWKKCDKSLTLLENQF